MSPRSHDPHATRSRRVAVRLSSEDGFGLVEAVIALGIIFGLVLVLMRTLDTSTRVLVETRRTSAANTFAVELLERAQALEWEHIGLAVSTNGADCATEQVGCATYLAEFPELASDGAGGYTFDGEQMVFTNSDTFRPFLSFHEQVERDGTLFDRYIFVSSVDSDVDGDEDYRRVTAAVSWIGAGGFRNRIMQAALITAYVRPSQPLIRTDVLYSEGSVDLTGLTETGALIPGTGWAEVIPTSREQVVFGVTHPSVKLTALSDFVSEARTLISSSGLSLLRWAGLDGVIGTADDAISRIDPTELSFFSDDDVFTTPIGQDGPGVAVIPALVQNGAAPRDLVYLEVGFADWWGGAAANTSMTGRADAVTTGMGADGLPYAEAMYSGVGKAFLGTREYANAAVIALYDVEGHDIDTHGTGVDFIFYQRGNRSSADPLTVSATADRAVSSGDQTTTGSISIDTPDFTLLYDDAMEHGYNDFEGWVLITMPDLAMATGNVEAGEAATNLFLPTSGNIVVRTWDPSIEDYITHPAIDYAAFGSDCTAVLAPVIIDVGTVAAPLLQTLDGGHNPDHYPDLAYEVVGTVTINPWCSQTTTDGSLITRSVWQTVGPMVSVTIAYKVTDRFPLFADALADPITLFDFTLGVTGDTVQIVSVYTKPDA